MQEVFRKYEIAAVATAIVLNLGMWTLFFLMPSGALPFIIKKTVTPPISILGEKSDFLILPIFGIVIIITHIVFAFFIQLDDKTKMFLLGSAIFINLLLLASQVILYLANA